MYTPKHFTETRTEVLHQLIGAQPLVVAAQATRQLAANAAMDDWNALNARNGSFADDHKIL